MNRDTSRSTRLTLAYEIEKLPLRAPWPLFMRADRTPAVSYEDGRIWCPEAVWGGSSA